jgi:hypothetical protein
MNENGSGLREWEVENDKSEPWCEIIQGNVLSLIDVQYTLKMSPYGIAVESMHMGLKLLD